MRNVNEVLTLSEELKLGYKRYMCRWVIGTENSSLVICMCVCAHVCTVCAYEVRTYKSQK